MIACVLINISKNNSGLKGSRPSLRASLLHLPPFTHELQSLQVFHGGVTEQ